MRFRKKSYYLFKVICEKTKCFGLWTVSAVERGAKSDDICQDSAQRIKLLQRQ